MLPGVVGMLAARDNRIRRAKQIANKILSADPPFDLICLQELFDEEVRDYFTHAFRARDRLENIVAKLDSHDSLADRFHEDSGLFFASRYPISNPQFQEHPAHASADAFANKGLFQVSINLGLFGPGLRAQLFHTHRQSDNKQVG